MSIVLKSKVSLKLEEEMLFKCDLGQLAMQNLYIDENELCAPI